MHKRIKGDSPLRAHVVSSIVVTVLRLVTHSEKLLNSSKQRFPSKLTLLEKTKTKLRHFKLLKTAKDVLMIVLPLLIFDTLVTLIGASYLSKNIATFLGKSRTVILSDLLFLEGSVIFAIGTFVAIIRFLYEERPSHETTTKTTENSGQTPEKQIDLSILLMLTGAVLIGLSIAVGTLPR